MRNKLLALLLIVIVHDGYCQDHIVLSGKVIDAETDKPLAFSTISVQGLNIGVVTNFLGEFEFKFGSDYLGDSLHISMMGYHPQNILIDDIDPTSRLVISLSEYVIELQEIQISAKKLTAKEIVEKAIENIPINYPNSPYLQKGFTRSHKRECGKYITLYEAAFDLYGNGYHKKSPERVYVNEARQSKSIDYYHSRVLRNNRNLFIAKSHINDVLFKRGALLTTHNEYEVAGFTEANEHLVYIIKTAPSKHVSHKIYIDSENFAILKLEMVMGTPEGEDRNPHLNRGASSDSLNFQVTTISKTLQFERIESKYFLKYSDWLVEGLLSNKETDEVFCDWGFRFEMMFDEFTTENIEKPSTKRLMRPKPGKDPESTTFNAPFWENYSLLDQFPITPQIIEDLESAGLLTEEFKQYEK